MFMLCTRSSRGSYFLLWICWNFGVHKLQNVINAIREVFIVLDSL